MPNKVLLSTSFPLRSKLAAKHGVNFQVEILNPNRTSKNVDGDFYSTGYWMSDGECGDCLDCGLPEGEAPELLADLDKFDYTHFVKQPVTNVETERACNACEVCCVNALRYGGKNIEIIQRLYNTPDYCDYLVTPTVQLMYALDEKGEFLPFSLKYKTAAYIALKKKYGYQQSLLHRIMLCFKS